MSTDPNALGTVVDRLLPRRLCTPTPASAFAPANIALSKYWGKRDTQLNLPLNASLSVSLGSWGSTTHVASSPSGRDEVVFNGDAIDLKDPSAQRILHHCNLFRRTQNIPLRIVTSNSIPTAAGLASSASGFAALTLALIRAFRLELPCESASMIARLGSGSATRSLWHGFVRWDHGTRADGTDCHGNQMAVNWPEFRIAVIPVDTRPKTQSSRDGMNHTVRSSPLFAAWPALASVDCKQIEEAVRDRNLTALGTLAEANALAMHATMIAARPALTYLTSETWKVLETLRHARHRDLSAYATMDAGPNVKLIFERDSENDVKSLFPDAKVIAPFEDQPKI
ncbi:MAG: diphosphomevalonate decarboxylase [Pseudomonadota bacterium]